MAELEKQKKKTWLWKSFGRSKVKGPLESGTSLKCNLSTFPEISLKSIQNISWSQAIT